MVAKGLIEGDRSVQSRCLERFLIINGVSATMSAGTGGNDLAVNDVKIPPQFVVHARVADIPQRDEEIKGIFLVQGVCRLNGGVKDMGCVHHDRRVDGPVLPGVSRKLCWR